MTRGWIDSCLRHFTYTAGLGSALRATLYKLLESEVVFLSYLFIALLRPALTRPNNGGAEDSGAEAPFGGLVQ